MEQDFYVYKAVITEAYDGDTLTAVVDLGFSVNLEMRVRLLHVDTPELRLEEYEEGIKVRDIVREMTLNKDVVIRTHKDKAGKYGRYLAEVYIGDLYLNQWLLDNGYAEPYIE